jgi:L-fucose dehydrogenase
MDLQLQDKVVLITGGAKGIGAAITRKVCEEAATAVVVDKDADAGELLVGSLRKEGRRCLLIATELSSAENCSRAVEAAVKEFGKLDALVNNAGVNDRVGLEHGNSAEFVESLRRNLLHYFEMAHFALPCGRSG